MKSKIKFLMCFLLWVTGTVFAQPYIIHIQSPWSADASLADASHTLSVTSQQSGTTTYDMTSEGDGWHVYSYTDAINATTTRTFSVSTGTETWSESVTLSDILDYGTEVWVYVDAATGAYTLSATGPTAVPPASGYTVWFKSPWGDKIVPNMIYGADTLPMTPSSEAISCGWFSYTFTAAQLVAAMPVYFQRPLTSDAYPSSTTLDVASMLSSNNAAYIDGTAETPSISATIGSAGTCFDPTYTIHAYWGSTGTPYLTAGTANNAAMTAETGLDNWYTRDIGTSLSATAVSVAIKTGGGGNATTTNTFTVAATNALFPTGVYEVWLILNANGSVTISYSKVSSRVIRLMSPWTNTTPSMVIGEDSIHMTAVDNYCGWFETTYQGSETGFDVFFKQTIGKEIYTASGLTAGNQISLDSIFAIGDTVWIKPNPYPTGSPVLYSKFPEGSLGECPIRTIAVMMFDWYDGSNTNPAKYQHDDTGTDLDFGGGDPSSNTQCPQGAGSVVLGMVESVLGSAGLPVRATNFPESECTNATHLDSWFLAETQSGTTYTNATCRDLTLTLDSAGFWFAQKDTESSEGGLFLLDDFQYLDDANTVLNLKYDSIPVRSGGQYHNYGFTMKVQAEFQYVPGQYFEFMGDDDVWVFIDNRLVVDLGGVHGQQSGSVLLDTIGQNTGNLLVEGQTYQFHIFYAERNPYESNFKMRTSMDLHTDRTFYSVKISTADSLLQYQIWQILQQEGLNCDFSGMVVADTTLAASDFLLTGGNLPTEGVTLVEGLNYGGITIDAGYTGFTIDTASIVRTRSLAPGTYCLHYSLKSDGSLYGEIYFTVSEYPLPDIVFTDSLWQPILADTTVLGEWTNIAYPVRVEVLYAGETCEGCTEQLFLTTSDSLIFLDSNGNQITSIILQNGKALFWVMGTGAVVNGSFTVAGTAVGNTLVWPNINLQKPPVPTLEIAEMFDRTGEGIPDSVYFTYSRALQGKDAVDSLLWYYGDSTGHFMGANDVVAALVDSATIVVTTSAGFTEAQFTGLQGSSYTGSVTTWYTYIPTTGVDANKEIPFEIQGRITDKVGPILLSASVANKDDDISVLTLIFSESLEANDMGVDSLFEYRFWRSGQMNGSVMRPSSGTSFEGNFKYDVYFSARASEVPLVGDSVRFVPGVAIDLGGARPHANNPWVRIVGEQKAVIESTDLVELTPETAPPPESPTVTIYLFDKDKDIEDVIAETGLPGQLVDFDMAELLYNENSIRDSALSPLTADSISITYESYYFTNLGQYVNSSNGTILCSDSIFGGDCTANPGNVFLSWNMRSAEGRLVGTGAYIARLDIRVKVGSRVVVRNSTESVWGVRRSRGVL